MLTLAGKKSTQASLRSLAFNVCNTIKRSIVNAKFVLYILNSKHNHKYPLSPLEGEGRGEGVKPENDKNRNHWRSRSHGQGPAGGR